MREPKGFTLLELIVSLAIVTMVAAMLVGMMGIGGKVGYKAYRSTESSMRAARQLNEERDTLRNAYSFSMTFKGINEVFEIRQEGEILTYQEGEVTYVKFKPFF
ncbi:MAG: PulJ/GspJ family protein [Cellulosilyticaceae bacterium]